jgi:hypothetical protein
LMAHFGGPLNLSNPRNLRILASKAGRDRLLSVRSRKAAR